MKNASLTSNQTTMIDNKNDVLKEYLIRKVISHIPKNKNKIEMSNGIIKMLNFIFSHDPTWFDKEVSFNYGELERIMQINDSFIIDDIMNLLCSPAIELCVSHWGIMDDDTLLATSLTNEELNEMIDNNDYYNPITGDDLPNGDSFVKYFGIHESLIVFFILMIKENNYKMENVDINKRFEIFCDITKHFELYNFQHNRNLIDNFISYGICIFIFIVSIIPFSNGLTSLFCSFLISITVIGAIKYKIWGEHLYCNLFAYTEYEQRILTLTELCDDYISLHHDTFNLTKSPASFKEIIKHFNNFFNYQKDPKQLKNEFINRCSLSLTELENIQKTLSLIDFLEKSGLDKEEIKKQISQEIYINNAYEEFINIWKDISCFKHITIDKIEYINSQITNKHENNITLLQKIKKILDNNPNLRLNNYISLIEQQKYFDNQYGCSNINIFLEDQYNSLLQTVLDNFELHHHQQTKSNKVVITNLVRTKTE